LLVVLYVEIGVLVNNVRITKSCEGVCSIPDMCWPFGVKGYHSYI